MIDEIARKLIYDIHSGKEIDELLKQHNLLDVKYWEPVGGNYNNFPIIDNQATRPDSALGERIINSVDSLLMRKCQENGIPMTGPQAPKTMWEAAEKFYNIPGQHLYNMKLEDTIAKLAEIYLCVSGHEGLLPTINLLDLGEGQTPDKIESTFLSLPSRGSPNKAKIPFVQGIFNQGSSGSYKFSAYVLILTKRAPSLLDSTSSSKDHEWGWTLVKKFETEDEHVSSIFRYLRLDGSTVSSFAADTLPLAPPIQIGKSLTATPYDRKIESGTLVKIFDYKLRPLLNSQAWAELPRIMRRVFYELPLPVRIYEMRQHLKGQKGDAANLVGMQYALMSNKKKLEKNFPIPLDLTIDGVGSLHIDIWAMDFSKGTDQSSRWFGKYAISFIVNGQSHYDYEKQVLRRNELDLQNLEGSIYVAVDLSQIPRKKKEVILKPDRSSVDESEEFLELQGQLFSELKNHPVLRALNNKKFEEKTKGADSDEEFTKKVFQRLASANPLIRDLLLGSNVPVSGGFDWVKVPNKIFVGKASPSFFRLKEKKS